MQSKYDFEKVFTVGELGPGEMMVQPCYPFMGEDYDGTELAVSIPLNEVLDYRDIALRKFAEDPKVTYGTFEEWRARSLGEWAQVLLVHNEQCVDGWRITPDEYKELDRKIFELNQARIAKRDGKTH